MAAWTKATSSTDLAMGPTVSMLQARGITPLLLTRPTVGRRPEIPAAAAGNRIDPPMSVPTENRHSPAATAAPEPPLDPAAFRDRFQGFFVTPKCSFSVLPPHANSWRLVLP